jgi:hypothetical protein
VNEIELLARLGAQARDEADPTIDITRRVHERLLARKVRPVDGPLAFTALGVCSLAALAVIGMLLRAPADSVTALVELVTSGGEPELLLRLFES